MLEAILCLTPRANPSVSPNPWKGNLRAWIRHCDSYAPQISLQRPYWSELRHQPSRLSPDETTHNMSTDYSHVEFVYDVLQQQSKYWDQSWAADVANRIEIFHCLWDFVFDVTQLPKIIKNGSTSPSTYFHIGHSSSSKSCIPTNPQRRSREMWWTRWHLLSSGFPRWPMALNPFLIPVETEPTINIAQKRKVERLCQKYERTSPSVRPEPTMLGSCDPNIVGSYSLGSLLGRPASDGSMPLTHGFFSILLANHLWPTSTITLANIGLTGLVTSNHTIRYLTKYVATEKIHPTSLKVVQAWLPTNETTTALSMTIISQHTPPDRVTWMLLFYGRSPRGVKGVDLKFTGLCPCWSESSSCRLYELKIWFRSAHCLSPKPNTDCLCYRDTYKKSTQISLAVYLGSLLLTC